MIHAHTAAHTDPLALLAAVWCPQKKPLIKQVVLMFASGITEQLYKEHKVRRCRQTSQQPAALCQPMSVALSTLMKYYVQNTVLGACRLCRRPVERLL